MGKQSGVSRRGFTLMELMVVVVMLSILAALIMPQTSNAAVESREKSAHSQVQTLRRQIELYRLEHNALPDLSGGWSALIQTSTVAGRTVGPYLMTAPTNPLNGMSTVIDGTGADPAPSACGYIYDYNAGSGTGMLYATNASGTTVFVE